MSEDLIESTINSIPFTIDRIYEHQCSCGHIYNKKHKYSLEIKILQHYVDKKPSHRYLAFYKCADFGNGDDKRYIGRAVGMGQKTIFKALEELKGYIIDEH